MVDSYQYSLSFEPGSNAGTPNSVLLLLLLLLAVTASVSTTRMPPAAPEGTAITALGGVFSAQKSLLKRIIRFLGEAENWHSDLVCEAVL